MSFISLVRSPVTLRRPTLDDAPALAALLCPEISCWLAEWPQRMDAAVARERIAKELADAADGSALPLIVEMEGYGPEPVVAGWFRLRLAAYDRELALMTCWLGREFQGRGAARDAVSAAARLAMPELGARRIGAYVMHSNKRSIRVLEESGLCCVGERAISVPSRGSIEVVLCYEREADTVVLPMEEAIPALPAAA